MFLISPSETKNFMEMTNHEIQMHFPEKTRTLAKKLQSFDVEDYVNYFHLSEMLAEEAVEEISDFPNKTKQACELYSGNMYQEIQNPSDAFFNDEFLIISAFYGIVKPHDYISPYRLNFDGKDFLGKWGENLYRFWGDSITDFIIKEDPKYVVDLTDKEDMKAIDTADLKCPLYHVEMDRHRLGPTNTRRVRGQIVNYVINNKITDLSKLEDLKTNFIKEIKVDDKNKTIVVECNC